MGPTDIVIFKPSYGAFYDTALATVLQNLGRDTIIITGTLTNFCCGTTARQGYERGFQVVVASDLTATDDPDLQDAELCVLRKGFARVSSASDILAAFTGTVTEPERNLKLSHLTIRSRVRRSTASLLEGSPSPVTPSGFRGSLL